MCIEHLAQFKKLVRVFMGHELEEAVKFTEEDLKEVKRGFDEEAAKWDLSSLHDQNK